MLFILMELQSPESDCFIIFSRLTNYNYLSYGYSISYLSSDITSEAMFLMFVIVDLSSLVAFTYLSFGIFCGYTIDYNLSSLVATFLLLLLALNIDIFLTIADCKLLVSNFYNSYFTSSSVNVSNLNKSSLLNLAMTSFINT